MTDISLTRIKAHLERIVALAVADFDGEISFTGGPALFTITLGDFPKFSITRGAFVEAGVLDRSNAPPSFGRDLFVEQIGQLLSGVQVTLGLGDVPPKRYYARR